MNAKKAFSQIIPTMMPNMPAGEPKVEEHPVYGKGYEKLGAEATVSGLPADFRPINDRAKHTL